MKSLAGLIGFFGMVFAGSVTASYMLFSAIRRGKMRSARAIRPTGALKLRGTQGMYRSTFCDAYDGHWVISSPLQRDVYVPLHVGDSLFVEAPVVGGTAFFRADIVERRALTHEFVIKLPNEISIRQRRGTDRESFGAGLDCTINGREAKLLNRSTTGALIISTLRPDHGDRLKINLEGEEIEGYALDCEPAAMGNKQGARIRVLLQH